MKLSDTMEKYEKISKIPDRVIRVGNQKVTIKSILTAEKFIEAAYNMSALCFEGVEKTIFRPEYREIARRYIIIKYFTDIDIDDMSIEEIFASTQKGTWFRDVEREVTSLQLWREIEIAADKDIDYKIMTLRNSFDELCEVLKVSAEKFTDTDTIEKVAEKLETLDNETIVKTIVEK